MKTSTDPNYCQRVTANDGALGRAAPARLSGQREDNLRHPEDVTEALDQCRRSQYPQHRLDAPHQLDDRVQADRRTWHPPDDGNDLGRAEDIGLAFVGFQQYLYQPQVGRWDQDGL